MKLVHPWIENEEDEILVLSSHMEGEGLQFDDDYLDDARWRTPTYLQSLPIELRWDIMYHVHVILENIYPHGDVKQNFCESQEYILTSWEAQQYLADQIRISKRTLH